MRSLRIKCLNAAVTRKEQDNFLSSFIRIWNKEKWTFYNAIDCITTDNLHTLKPEEDLTLS